MELSAGEKLILMMLSEIYERLEIKGEIKPRFVREAICSGNLWGLRWQHPGLFDVKPKDPAIVREVCDILDMWSFLEAAVERLSAAELGALEQAVGPVRINQKFPGFDGNNEHEHRSVALFLINDMDRFSSFKGRDLNSHGHTLEGYRRMLRAFKPTRETLADRKLCLDELTELFVAKRRLYDQPRQPAN